MQKFKKEDYRIPVYSWCSDIEDGAMKQIDNVARLPFVEKHVVICSDTHQGYGVPIGCVAAFKNVVSPHAIGYDIACGICAVKTNIKSLPKDDLKTIFSEIRKVIPVGVGKHHKEMQNRDLMPDCKDVDFQSITYNQYDSALRQIGTLGGGK